MYDIKYLNGNILYSLYIYDKLIVNKNIKYIFNFNNNIPAFSIQ